MGAIPESQIKTFIQGLIAGAGAEPGEPEGPDIEGALKQAAEALAAHDLPTAAHIFGEILQDEPGHPKAVAGLARCYLESGDVERAKKTLGLGQTRRTVATRRSARSKPKWRSRSGR